MNGSREERGQNFTSGIASIYLSGFKRRLLFALASSPSTLSIPIENNGNA